jgi:hypothetical protein
MIRLVPGCVSGLRVDAALCLLLLVRGDIDQHPVAGPAAQVGRPETGGDSGTDEVRVAATAGGRRRPGAGGWGWRARQAASWVSRVVPAVADGEPVRRRDRAELAAVALEIVDLYSNVRLG